MVNDNQTQGILQTFSQASNPFAPLANLGSNITFSQLPKEMNQDHNFTYSVSGVAYNTLAEYIPTHFNGTVQLNRDARKYSSEFIQAIWYMSEDLEAWIENLALSMTEVVRSGTASYGIGTDLPSTESNSFYNGTGYGLGYEIRWLWIILPAALVASSILILLATMIETARSPVKAWKGSPLTLLFMGVDSEIKKNAAGSMERCNGLEESVGKIAVKVGKDHEGNWFLR